MIKLEKKNFSWENAKKMMAKVDAFKEQLEEYRGEDVPEVSSDTSRALSRVEESFCADTMPSPKVTPPSNETMDVMLWARAAQASCWQHGMSLKML